MRSHIEKLRLKAVEKSREYFINVIAELRRAKTNVRMIQTEKLLKYMQLMNFLDDAAPDVHQEIRNIYTESMAKTISSLFKTYQSQLSKLDSKMAGKHDLICVDEQAAKDMFSTKRDMSKRGDPFSLGDRARVLDIKEEKPIMVHIAIAEKEKVRAGGASRTTASAGTLIDAELILYLTTLPPSRRFAPLLHSTPTRCSSVQ